MLTKQTISCQLQVVSYVDCWILFLSENFQLKMLTNGELKK